MNASETLNMFRSLAMFLRWKNALNMNFQKIVVFVSLQDDAGELSGSEGLGGASEGGGAFLAGWDVFECTASLEKPLDRFLFNSYLTSCLQASVDRSVGDKPGLIHLSPVCVRTLSSTAPRLGLDLFLSVTECAN